MSDRDVLTSQFWKKFMSLHGIQIQLSIAYHPRKMANLRLSIAVLKHI